MASSAPQQAVSGLFSKANWAVAELNEMADSVVVAASAPTELVSKEQAGLALVEVLAPTGSALVVVSVLHGLALVVA